MFDSNTDYSAGSYLRVAGDYFLTIISVEYDDQYFPKYTIEAEVATGSHAGEIVQGTIAKPTEKYMKDNDRALGGFSFARTGAYVVGAGITSEVNALPKITIGAIAKMLVGKTIKAHVQLTRKSQQLKEEGETVGLYYEIGRIYKRSEWETVETDTKTDEPSEYNLDGLFPPKENEDTLPF